MAWNISQEALYCKTTSIRDHARNGGKDWTEITWGPFERWKEIKFCVGGYRVLHKVI